MWLRFHSRLVSDRQWFRIASGLTFQISQTVTMQKPRSLAYMWMIHTLKRVQISFAVQYYCANLIGCRILLYESHWL